MRLHVLHGGELGHVRRAGAPEHLMRDSLYAGVLTGFLQSSEEKIVGVDGCAAVGREDESLGAYGQPGGGAVLQQARDGGAIDQGRQTSRKDDAASCPRFRSNEVRLWLSLI